jgi:hypothetical protein
MHRLALGLVLLAAVSGTAAAEGRVSAGLGLGVTHSEEHALQGAEPSSTVGLWGRLKMGRRVSGQVEISKVQTEDGSGVAIRQGSALLVVDLGTSRLVPVALVGVGVDNESTEYSDEDFVHAFLGAGLEYRAASGITIGLDFRMGARATTEPQYKPLAAGSGEAYFLAPSQLAEGEFRSARLTVGVRF